MTDLRRITDDIIDERDYAAIYRYLFGAHWDRAVVLCDRCDDHGKVWESDVAVMKVRVCPDCGGSRMSIVDEGRLLQALGTIVKPCEVWTVDFETFSVYGCVVDIPLSVEGDRRLEIWRKREVLLPNFRLENYVLDWRWSPPDPLGDTPESWEWFGWIEDSTVAKNISIRFDFVDTEIVTCRLKKLNADNAPPVFKSAQTRRASLMAALQEIEDV